MLHAVAILGLLCAAVEPPAEPVKPGTLPPQPPAAIFPFQASAAAMGLLGHGSTFGLSIAASYVRGRAGDSTPFLAEREGLFWGVGAIGFFGSTDLETCVGATRCAARRYGGAGARLGYAFLDDRKFKQWPDAYVSLQVSGFLGAEYVPSAPLTPSGSAGVRGMRIDLGLTAIALSKATGWIAWELFKGLQRSEGLILAFLFVPLVLLNHLELNLEWSTAAISPGGLRVGLSMGSSF